MCFCLGQVVLPALTVHGMPGCLKPPGVLLSSSRRPISGIPVLFLRYPFGVALPRGSSCRHPAGAAVLHHPPWIIYGSPPSTSGFSAFLTVYSMLCLPLVASVRRRLLGRARGCHLPRVLYATLTAFHLTDVYVADIFSRHALPGRTLGSGTPWPLFRGSCVYTHVHNNAVVQNCLLHTTSASPASHSVYIPAARHHATLLAPSLHHLHSAWRLARLTLYARKRRTGHG